MSVSVRSSARAAIFVFAGAALASVLMGPAVGSGGGSQPGATIRTRTVSCAGLSFYPADHRDGVASTGTLRHRASHGGQGAYLCDPGLPNGAVVTKVQFTVKDGHSLVDISDCALVRSGLTPSTATSYWLMAGPFSTSFEPGTKRFTDTTITFATIDNTRFGYWLQCRMDGTSDAVGIFGANVTYRITTADG